MQARPSPPHWPPSRLVIASWRLFTLAPVSAAALWALATISCFALDQGAMQHLMALARPGEQDLGRLGPVAASTLVGWACDCLVQALWAQLAWQALSGGNTRLRALWARLRGAWTGVGLLVAYASLALAALAWPQLLRGLEQLPPGAGLALAAVGLGLALTLGWVGLRVALGVPAAAAERKGGRAAWAASWQLTRGRLVPVVFVMLLGSACGIAVSLAAKALPQLFSGQDGVMAALSAGVQCAFGGLPGTLYWAWRQPEAKA